MINNMKLLILNEIFTLNLNFHRIKLVFFHHHDASQGCEHPSFMNNV